MKAQIATGQENKSQAAAHKDAGQQGEYLYPITDKRPAAIAQRKLQEMADNSPRARPWFASAGTPGPFVVQRNIVSYKPKGKASPAEMLLLVAFAVQVDGLANRAYEELVTGNIGDWKGAKITTFLSLLERKSPMAKTWAGNAIEERVYALMGKPPRGNMFLDWQAQWLDSMGGASFPDIVVPVPGDSSRCALLDITSEVGHIEGKAGNWLGSNSVYVAEIVFPSIKESQIPAIRKNIFGDGGVSSKSIKRMQAEALKEQEKRLKLRAGVTEEAYKRINSYSTFKEFAEAEFGGNVRNATRWAQDSGVARRKGMLGWRKGHVAVYSKRKKRVKKKTDPEKAKKLFEETIKAKKSESEGSVKKGKSLGVGGDCLFDSYIAVSGGGAVAALRLAVANEMRAHPERYIGFLDYTGYDDIVDSVRDAADFLEDAGNWDADYGDLAPLALANATGRRIVIHNFDGSVRARVGPLHNPVHIFYNGADHYVPGV